MTTGAAAATIGRLKGFHGQMGMFVRALAYMMSHGSDGLRQVAEDAVLNANYLRVRLQDVLSLAFPGICMHEVLFDDGFLKDTGVTTLDFAKALIDEGYHPMTMYFPLVVHGALLIEPTETESKASLDQFVAVLRGLAEQPIDQTGRRCRRFRAAPVLTPRRRLDETGAARKPVLRWRRPEQQLKQRSRAGFCRATWCRRPSVLLLLVASSMSRSTPTWMQAARIGRHSDVEISVDRVA